MVPGCLSTAEGFLVGFPEMAETGLESPLFQNCIPIDIFLSFPGFLKIVIFSCMVLLHFKGFLQHVRIVFIDGLEEPETLGHMGVRARVIGVVLASKEGFVH